MLCLIIAAEGCMSFIRDSGQAATYIHILVCQKKSVFTKLAKSNSWIVSSLNSINYLMIGLLAINGMSAYIFFSGEILYTSTTDHEGVGLCAQESHPALSMRHACPSSDSNNYYYSTYTTASHNSSSFAILFPRRGHYHQSTPDQEGTNIPLLPPSGPPVASNRQ